MTREEVLDALATAHSKVVDAIKEMQKIRAHCIVQDLDVVRHRIKDLYDLFYMEDV